MPSWDGMYPYGIKCKVCGAILGGRQEQAIAGYYSYDRPAELYAGTFTGLCYKCEGAGVFTVKAYWDGALRLSYPPHCPSWRRDREEYTAYPDCPECKGAGFHWADCVPAIAGRYRHYCETCFARFYAEPHRAARNALADQERSLREQANAYWVVELGIICREMGFTYDIKTRSEWAPEQKAAVNALTDKWIGLLKKATAALHAPFDAEETRLQMAAWLLAEV